MNRVPRTGRGRRRGRIDGLDIEPSTWASADQLPSRDRTCQKAHVLNLRAMESIDDVGAAESTSTPPEAMAATAFYAGGGDDPDAGRRIIAKLQSWEREGSTNLAREASLMIQRNCPRSRPNSSGSVPRVPAGRSGSTTS